LRPGSESAAEFLLGENMVDGSILCRDGLFWFNPSGSDFRLGPLQPGALPGGGETACTLLVRSGNIHLERDGEAPAATGSWGAVIRRVVFGRTHVDVYCQGNGLWQVSLSLGRWQELGLNLGELVTLWVRMENLHLIPAVKN
jgi:molybdate transport system ATP-binding protein